ncbi:MAG: multidrug effflux MFS transporter [Xanthobacteraceae bacterium]|jgi:DHA1 family bicyclomycin/chloramphenicol resistance-like MFS transporter
MLRPGTFALTLLLSLLTALGPLSMDTYLPALPAISEALHAPIAQVQFTISSYLIGFAVGQMFYGPISDRYGRRPVILAALALNCVAAMFCALTPSIGTLTVARFIQALGGAGCIVLARAAVRDLYSGVRAGRELSLMGSITAFAPIVAPMIGGALEMAYSWRAIFVLLMVFALFAAAMAARFLPETLAPQQRNTEPFSLHEMVALYRSVLMHRGFLALVAILSVTFVGLFAWISGAPIVMQSTRYGLTPLTFGIIFASGAGGYMIGAYAASKVVMRFGLDRTIGIGCVIMTFGGLAMATGVALDLSNVEWFVGPMMIYLAGMGLTLPQTQAAALTPFPDRAGTASSLLGFAQQTSAAIAAAAIGLYLGSSAWPVAGTVAAMGCLSLVIWALTRNVRKA